MKTQETKQIGCSRAVLLALSRAEACALYALANDLEIGCSIVNDAGPKLRAAKRALRKLRKAANA